jgi:hypothetical protein
MHTSDASIGPAGGTQAATPCSQRHQPTRNDTKRQGQSHSRSMVAGRSTMSLSSASSKKQATGRPKPALEIPFQLSDGDVERSCSFSAYLAFPSRRIARALLRVDGRLLYDEDPKT